jgi:alkyl sulfatase BDS1-like metallo-beta-lactamase superfamily hydrolase
MPGETFDHLTVWLPHERVLFPGDLFYCRFPMLSNPLKPDRPVAKWIESLERMREFKPDHFVPSHGPPFHGTVTIDALLANYCEAIRHVHDQTVKGINEQLTLAQILARVRLPDKLARLPYLAERYGTVGWAVKGIFRQYTGWYDFNPAHLNLVSRSVFAQAVLDATGGPARLMVEGRRALAEGKNQIALELTDVVLAARPRHARARKMRLAALARLGKSAPNAVERNIYRAGAKALSRALAKGRK